MSASPAAATHAERTAVQSHVIRSSNPDAAIFLLFHIRDAQAFCGMLKSVLAHVAPSDGQERVRFVEAIPGEGWLARLGAPLDSLRLSSDGEKGSEASSATIAFTWTGLQALAVDADTLQSFPPDFRDGMAARASLLGDVGDAAPENWQGWLGSRLVHGIFQINLRGAANGASTESDDRARARAYDQFISRVELCQKNSAAWRKLGLEILQVETGWSNFRTDPSGYRYRVEHFGFNDGISQPFVDAGWGDPPPGGGTPRPGGTWDPIARGELLLGYPDEDGVVQTRPGNALLRVGGTYMVLRKLEQDVTGFRQFIKRHDGGAKAVDSRLAAQMVGRWSNGTPLATSPLGPRSYSPATVDEEINDFRFQEEDPRGSRCPIGAHIRRANPRDANNRDEARRHRIWRRGIAYGGPPLSADSDGDGRVRGMLFVALNARIDQQFEFLQNRWINTGEFIGQVGAGRCPLVGNHRGGVADQFLSPDRPAPIVGLPRFVTLRGGEYFFVPSIAALAAMAANNHFALDDPEEKAAARCAEEITGESGGAYANFSLASTPQVFDPEALFRLARSKLLPPGSPPFLDMQLPFIPHEGAAPTTRNVALIGRYKYVLEALHLPDVFSTRPYAAAIAGITHGEQMVLGLPDGEERSLRLKIWRDAVDGYSGTPREDIVQAAVARILARYAPRGKLDIAMALGRVIPLVLAELYYGLEQASGGPSPDWLSPTYTASLFNELEITSVPADWPKTLPYMPRQDIPVASLQAWTRFAFLEVFGNIARARELTEVARRSTEELFNYLGDVIYQAHRPPCSKETLLACMIEKGPSSYTVKDGSTSRALTYEEFDRRILLILAEQIIGGTDTINKALVNVVNFLLDRRDLMELAADPKVSTGTLSAVIRECLRFDPVGPLMFRLCEADYTFKDESDKRWPIKRGTLVCLLAKSAMFDKDAFKDPDTFRLDRPADKYLNFGEGLHRCSGAELAEIVLCTALRGLLRFPQLRRAAGAAGEVQQPLQLPNAMMVRL